MPDDQGTGKTPPLASHGGPGPFVTSRETTAPDGRRIVRTSRRHRKGLGPIIFPAGELEGIRPRRASLVLWAPDRLSWWLALLFAIGSALFVLGAYLGDWPSGAPWLDRPASINGIFFTGSLFFTSASYLQFLEAVNGDVADVGREPTGFRWLAWKPRNLGYLAAAVQLVGTVLFNFNTGDSLLAGLSKEEVDLFIWAPDAVGCVCFLVASGLAYVEYGHGRLAIAFGNVSWWIVSLNLVGSVLFMGSAALTFQGDAPTTAGALWSANLYTLLGAVCFLSTSLLLIPELSEEAGTPSSP